MENSNGSPDQLLLAFLSIAFLLSSSSAGLAGTLAGTKRKAAVPAENAGLGVSIARHRHIAAIGALEGGDERGGRVHLFDLFTDEEIEVVSAPVPEEGAAFGYAVALDNEFLVISAPLEDSSRGVVYVRDLVAKDTFAISAPVPEEGALFGLSLSMEEGKLAIGSLREASGGDDRGAAYLYDLRSREFLFRIQSAEPEDGEEFGASVSLDGPLLAVSAWRTTHPDGSMNSGTVQLFKSSNGTPLRTIFHPNPRSVDGQGDFGVSVLLKDGILAVGALQERIGESGPDLPIEGAVHLFDPDSGVHLRRIASPRSRGESGFGRSITIEEGIIAVGAPEDTAGEDNQGAAYLFDIATGREMHRLIPEDTSPQGEFGFSVALSGKSLLVGARFDGLDAPRGSGSFYEYTLVHQPDLLLGADRRRLRGNDRYNPAGPAQHLRQRIAQRSVLFLKAENDGHLLDRFALRTRGPGRHFVLRATEIGSGRNLSGAMARGTHRTRTLFPGESDLVRVIASVRGRPRRNVRANVDVRLGSSGDRRLSDRGRLMLLHRTR